MKNLREIVSSWQGAALADVRRELRRHGFVTYTQAYDALQSRFSIFSEYYTKRKIDPYSEEFVERAFIEYFSTIRKTAGLVTVTLPEAYADKFGSRQIFGLGSRATVRRKYLEALTNHHE